MGPSNSNRAVVDHHQLVADLLTSPSRWLETNTVTSWPARPRSRLPISMIPAGSSPLDGSSSTSSAGSGSSAAAMPSRCLMPSENPGLRVPDREASSVEAIRRDAWLEKHKDDWV